jgi:hypothetical protein
MPERAGRNAYKKLEQLPPQSGGSKMKRTPNTRSKHEHASHLGGLSPA